MLRPLHSFEASVSMATKKNHKTSASVRRNIVEMRLDHRPTEVVPKSLSYLSKQNVTGSPMVVYVNPFEA